MRQHAHAPPLGVAGNTTRSRETFRRTYRKSPYARIKPEGGFCFIPAMALIATWWAYKARILGLVEVRVWLAFFEVVARRCDDRSNRFPDSVEHELATLVGVSEAQARTAVRRLVRTGFLLPKRTLSRWHTVPRSLVRDDGVPLVAAIDRVENHRRLAPVPRRLLRFLTQTARPVLWATVLGHLLRCLYYRNGQCAPDGRCKASWIAERFEVDARNVKAARRELVKQGVLIMDPTDQRSMNRWGPLVRFNLEWRGVAVERPSPPRRAENPRRLPPPYRNRELASRMGNQKPPPAAGACRVGRWRISESDLAAPGNLSQLYERLVGAGACPSGEAARLNFFALAARTRRVARVNAPGLLATLLRRRLWHFPTNADEDTARKWLRGLGHRTTPGVGAVTVGPGTTFKSTARGAAPAEPTSAGEILRRILPMPRDDWPATFGLQTSFGMDASTGREVNQRCRGSARFGPIRPPS
jgi:hypothetical protein